MIGYTSLEMSSCLTEGHDFEKQSLREIEIIKTTYDISLDSQISLLPRGFSPLVFLSFLLSGE